MYFAPVQEQNPPHGGSWLRDPISGALTLIPPEPATEPEPSAPEPTPEE
jgi:hypothetical protein